ERSECEKWIKIPEYKQQVVNWTQVFTKQGFTIEKTEIKETYTTNHISLAEKLEPMVERLYANYIANGRTIDDIPPELRRRFLEQSIDQWLNSKSPELDLTVLSRARLRGRPPTGRPPGTRLQKNTHEMEAPVENSTVNASPSPSIAFSAIVQTLIDSCAETKTFVLLNDLHSKYQTFRDNPRLGSVGDTDIHYTTQDTTFLPPKKSTLCEQTSDTNEDIIRPDDGSVDEINGSDNKQRDPIVMSCESDTKPFITDLLMSGPDSRRNTIFGQLFESNADLEPHVRTHVTDDHIQTSITKKSKFTFKCLAEECDHRFIAKINLIEHMLNSHRIEDTYECNDCDAVCLTTDEIIGHRHREHEMQTIVSTQEPCGEGFGRDTALRQHIQDIHTTSGQQSLSGELLDIDGYNRSDAVIVRQNANTITTHETTSDRYLKIGDNASKALYRRLRPKRHKCDYNGCHKRFADGRDLRLHRLIHSTDKPFKCTVNGCEYSCVTKYQLETHMNRHLGIKPYACTHEGCGKRFARKNNLQSHAFKHTAVGQRIHTTSGQQSLGAQLVDFDGFNGSDAVIVRQNANTITTHETTSGRHLKRRDNGGQGLKGRFRPKRCKCDYNGCHKAFADGRDLRLHRLTHSTDKPFKCTVNGCEYSCVTKYQFERHSNRHLGIKPYVCTHEGCGKGFSSKDCLQKHAIRH
ncbi:unnamed protein product, partial [Medioppia subpectinata]